MNSVVLKKYLLAFLTVALILLSCDNAEKPVTKEEAIAFAKELENAIRKGDGKFLDNAFDKKEFVKKMDLPDTEDGKGFAKGVAQKITIGTQIANSLSDHDNFEFIKHYIKDNRHHLIFRVYADENASLNYQDYELIKTNDKCSVADMYIYLTGETLAETMRDMYNSLYPGSFGIGDVSESEKVTDMNKLKELKDLMHSGKYTAAKQMYDGLPAYLKVTKTVVLLNVLITANLTLEEYNNAIKDFQEKFPNEPNMSLMMIDGYYLQKDYQKMLAAVNTLDSQINKDPLLDYHRYLSYDLLEDDKNSLACLKRLVKAMPDFQKGYIELIAVDLKNNNQSEADSLITLYRKKTKFNQTDLNTIISYYQ